MKALTLLSGIVFSSVVNATIHTVSNVATQPAQYTTVDDAIGQASAGDTIYITGSATLYNDFTFDKPLTIIGAGYANNGLESGVNNVYFTTGSIGSHLIGVVVNYIYPDANSSTNQNIVIERCNFYGLHHYGYALDGLIIKNCVFANSYVSQGWTNVLISNNLITGGISGPGSPIPSVLITNNTFIRSDLGAALAGFNAAIISNNIFWGGTPGDVSSMNYCAFSNNITYQTGNDILPYGNNAGSGNYIGIDPLFVNVPDQNGTVGYDYHLQAGSPGHNGGTDGTDVGIYGGGVPFPERMDGRARIPLVTEFNILNSTIPEGGSLNVQVKARKND